MSVGMLRPRSAIFSPASVPCPAASSRSIGRRPLLHELPFLEREFNDKPGPFPLLRRQAFLCGFDLGHTFRMIEQTLGRTRPELRTPAAADRCAWSGAAAHPHSASPTRAPLTPAPPCPAVDRGRPSGSKNRHPATRYDAGTTVGRPEAIAEHDQVRSSGTRPYAYAPARWPWGVRLHIARSLGRNSEQSHEPPYARWLLP